MNEAMKLDLLIPTYNRCDLLKLCLKSVLAANVPQGLTVRVIVIDNNSSDKTRETVESFPVEYLFVPRPGKSAALNEAIPQTSADIIGMIDDDELLDEDWFKVIHDKFTAQPELDYLGGPYMLKTEIPLPDWLPREYPGVIGIVRREHEVYFDQSGVDIHLVGGNVAIRRNALISVLPYPEKLGRIGNKLVSGEDLVISDRLRQRGFVGKAIPTMIIYHMIPPSRLTKRYYRRWVWDTGIGWGMRYKLEPIPYPTLLGVPRYRIGEVVRSLPHIFSDFNAQLKVIDTLGALYGRYLG